MRVAGVYPCDVELDPKIQHAVSEPYGLEMILAIAKEEGHDVELFMPFKEVNGKVVGISEEEMIERIWDYKPDVAGNRYPSYLYLKRDVEGLMNEPFDFFVLGEGEETFRELLREMDDGERYERVRGIAAKKDDFITFTPPRERNLHLDELPNALRFDIILNQVYKGISIPPLSENPRYAIMEASRGCFLDCDFCDVPQFYGKKLAFKSKERVVDELAELKDRGVDIFYFMDMNFTASQKYVYEFCDEIIKRGLDVSWYCMSNIDSVDGKWELLRAMKEAGCYKIAWGIESTDNDSLIRMNKGVNGNILSYEQTIRVLDKSIEAGLINQGYYIIGFPWENEEDILRNAERLKNIPIHQLNLGIFTPIPFSRLRYEMEKKGYVFDFNLERHDRNHLVFNHKYLNEKTLKALQKEIHSDFYDSRNFIDRVESSCSKDERYVRAFNDYFERMGKETRVGLRQGVAA